MHTVPALDHWPPVPLRPRRPARRPASVALRAEFRTTRRTWSVLARGATVSDALYDAWASIPAAGEWRLARFVPAETGTAA